MHDLSRIVARQPWDSLVEPIARTGTDVARTVDRLKQYTESLLQWNRGYSNLISRADEGRIVTRHITESLEPAGWMSRCGASDWLDLGSGGGLPAVPLALAGVGRRWTLVESRRNKTLFLRKIVGDLGLDNVTVELARLETLVEQLPDPGPFDAFTSRATLRLGPTLELAARCVSPGGHAYLWKGSRLEEEMAADDSWRRWWAEEDRLGLTGGQTVVVHFVRQA